MTRKTLTPTPSMSSRRQLVLTAIRQHFREVGRSPSYLEISIRVGIEPRHVKPHLKQLQSDGLITFRDRAARSIALVDRTANLSDDEIEVAVHSRGWQLVKSVVPVLAQVYPLDTVEPEVAALLSQLDHVT